MMLDRASALKTDWFEKRLEGLTYISIIQIDEHGFTHLGALEIAHR